MQTFEKLIEDCKKHKQQSMLNLYNICCEPVYNACYRIVQNVNDAEEIMQDAILKAFKNINKFSGNQKDFIYFVKRIAINQSIDQYRKQRKGPYFTNIDNESDQFIDDTDEEIYSIEKIKSKIGELPDGYRMVLNMHLLDDLEFEDIAKIMKIQPSTVRSQYARAKNKLRQMLLATNYKPTNY